MSAFDPKRTLVKSPVNKNPRRCIFRPVHAALHSLAQNRVIFAAGGFGFFARLAL